MDLTIGVPVLILTVESWQSPFLALTGLFQVKTNFSVDCNAQLICATAVIDAFLLGVIVNVATVVVALTGVPVVAAAGMLVLAEVVADVVVVLAAKAVLQTTAATVPINSFFMNHPCISEIKSMLLW